MLFAGLISATMSSADSNLLGAASIWSNDLLPLARGRQPEPAELVRQARAAVLVIGAAATAIAALNVRDLIAVLKIAFGLRAAGPFVPFLAGHYWRGGSRAGALWAMVGATVVMLALQLMGARPWGADPMLFGLAAGGVLYLGGSLARPDN